VKAVLSGKFISMNACIKNTDNSQLNNPMLHFKLLEKPEQSKLKTNRWREIIKIKG
jgi:hypothetical protein